MTNLLALLHLLINEANTTAYKPIGNGAFSGGGTENNNSGRYIERQCFH